MSDLILRQFLSGRDIAQGVMSALEMANLSYLVADPVSGDAFLVDPSWGPLDLLSIARSLGFRVAGILATHMHADHVGGNLWGTQVPGVFEIVQATGCQVHVHRADAPGVCQRTGLKAEQVVGHEDGDVIPLGTSQIRVLHTPGHSPGSACFLAEGNLLSGDTLFCDGCGRVDLPGSSPDEMIRTLTERLAALPPSTMVWPGHDYGGRKGSMEILRETNSCLTVTHPGALRGLIL